MADMFAVFGLLLIMGLAFPALLFVIWLSFPAAVDRAQRRIAEQPIRLFWLGAGVLLVIVLPLLALLNIPGPGQFMAGVIILVVLTLSTIGAAGIAAQLAQRLKMRNDDTTSAHTSFFYGATVLELAVIFPVIGWLLLLPIAIILAVGATTAALVRRQSQAPVQPSVAPSPAAMAKV